MCVASATDPDLIEIAMKHCGIKRYFSAFFSCETLKTGKSEPDIYLYACEFLGTRPEETWVFEDSLVAIETVTRLGMPTVGIYDRCNYGQDRIKEIATQYIDCGETLLKLIE